MDTENVNLGYFGSIIECEKMNTCDVERTVHGFWKCDKKQIKCVFVWTD